eukprot:g6372.t1
MFITLFFSLQKVEPTDLHCEKKAFFDESKTQRKVAIVMLDDRNILPVKSTVDFDFWQYAIAVNFSYAKANGFFFKLFRPRPSSTNSVSTHWHKAAVLLSVLQEPSLDCNDIIIYIDSDAIFRDHTKTPSDFLRQEMNKGNELWKQNLWNGASIASADMVLAAGDNGDMAVWMPWGFSVQWTNTGVVIMRKTNATEELLHFWKESAKRSDMEFYRKRWPYDQEAFNRLVYPPHRNKIAVLPTLTMNSPEGKWIAHLWGAVRESRKPLLRTAAESIGLSGQNLIETLSLIESKFTAFVPDWISQKNEL